MVAGRDHAKLAEVVPRSVILLLIDGNGNKESDCEFSVSGLVDT